MGRGYLCTVNGCRWVNVDVGCVWGVEGVVREGGLVDGCDCDMDSKRGGGSRFAGSAGPWEAVVVGVEEVVVVVGEEEEVVREEWSDLRASSEVRRCRAIT